MVDVGEDKLYQSFPEFNTNDNDPLFLSKGKDIEDEGQILDLHTLIKGDTIKVTPGITPGITPGHTPTLKNEAGKLHGQISNQASKNELPNEIFLKNLEKRVSTYSFAKGSNNMLEDLTSPPIFPVPSDPRISSLKGQSQPSSADLVKAKFAGYSASHYSTADNEKENAKRYLQTAIGDDAFPNSRVESQIREENILDVNPPGLFLRMSQAVPRQSSVHANARNFNNRAKVGSVEELEKSQNHTVVSLSSGENDDFAESNIPRVKSNGHLVIPNNSMKEARASLYSAEKNIGELNPSDIIIQANGGLANESTPNPKGMNTSADNSMRKDNKHRYDRDFLRKLLVNRTGVPTVTAKKRETTGALNLNGIDSATLHPMYRNDSQGGSGSAVGKYNNTKSLNFSLRKELASIEKQKYIKMKMEQFVLLFNKNANQGIEHLISSKLIEESPENIAHVLLVTEGLNKEQVGQYLGSYKEKNKEIYKAYCRWLDFRNLQFDQALRLLLSRFKLPGEAQQIERIVEVFAEVYHDDNPTVFPESGTPFVLAYSLLMLNVDQHSELIAQKNRMTKQQFIDNNSRICTTLSKEYLGQMFDNISKQKFESKADHIETIYNRLHQGPITIQGELLKNFENLANELKEGSKFTKYGRKGKSHERRVWISEKEDAILWNDSSTKSEKPRAILFFEVVNILVGHNSTQVLLKNKVPSEFDQLCLSILTKNRTLDLRAADIDTRIKWERYFRLMLIQRKDKSKDPDFSAKEQRRLAEKEKLSEFWKTEILPNWETHWDYENRKPKHMDFLYDQNRGKRAARASISKSGKSSPIWSIFKKKKKPAVKKNEKSPLTNEEDSQMDNEDVTEGDLEFLRDTNKQALLVTLWKKGIPSWLRSILWPISIGNQLEITENLYDLLLFQAKTFLSEPVISQTEISDSLRRMEMDLNDTLPSFPQILDRKQSILNVLEAFIFYRPDVGYVKGMCRLIIMLLTYCSEYQVFTCFINLTHSHHFISFFRGIMREIEWRIRFFNKVFEAELPFLCAHFKALDISSEMFLLEWFLSLFSMAITDCEIISRIWDSFLIEGEIYAIKTSVAILKYFELELKMFTFDGAIKFLRELPADIDEDVLFKMIERVDASLSAYQEEVRSQIRAETNSKVHQALLEN